MKVILSVPDEGYSERTWWRLLWMYLMKVIMSVPDILKKTFSEATRQSFIYIKHVDIKFSVHDAVLE
jgi:hypothetical protein